MEKEISPINEDEVLVKNLWMSVDPYMRGRMIDRKSYVPPFAVGKTLEGGAIGIDVESNCSDFKAGDYVNSNFGWREYFSSKANMLSKVNRDIGPLQAYLGTLGMPGMTAFFGLFEICKPIPGDTVVVSAASGAVGQLVGQLAKLMNCKVVGIAGNKKKCEYLTSKLNFDHVINYKEQNVFKEIIFNVKK